MKIISAIIFFGLLTPLGFVVRTFRMNDIRRRPDGRKSYWIERRPQDWAPDQFERDY